MLHNRRIAHTPAGSLATDEAAVDDLIRQYRKEKGQQRVVADRCGAPCVLCFAALCSNFIMHAAHWRLLRRAAGSGAPQSDLQHNHWAWRWVMFLCIDQPPGIHVFVYTSLQQQTPATTSQGPDIG